MKKIIAKEEYCMGCGLCEVYCTVQHSKSKDIIKAYNRENPRPLSRVNWKCTNLFLSPSNADTVKMHHVLPPASLVPCKKTLKLGW
jgi:Fe-S-cluster-containing hydrogenase component 2